MTYPFDPDGEMQSERDYIVVDRKEFYVLEGKVKDAERLRFVMCGMLENHDLGNITIDDVGYRLAYEQLEAALNETEGGN